MRQISSIIGASIISLCALLLFPLLLVKLTMFSSTYVLPLLGLVVLSSSDEKSPSSSSSQVYLSWYPPNATHINDLNAVISDTGVFGGFTFNSSLNPSGVHYGTYNWCNMPHVRK